jgi:hypothetical protein
VPSSRCQHVCFSGLMACLLGCLSQVAELEDDICSMKQIFRSQLEETVATLSQAHQLPQNKDKKNTREVSDSNQAHAFSGIDDQPG